MSGSSVADCEQRAGQPNTLKFVCDYRVGARQLKKMLVMKLVWCAVFMVHCTYRYDESLLNRRKQVARSRIRPDPNRSGMGKIARHQTVG